MVSSQPYGFRVLCPWELLCNKPAVNVVNIEHFNKRVEYCGVVPAFILGDYGVVILVLNDGHGVGGMVGAFPAVDVCFYLEHGAPPFSGSVVWGRNEKRPRALVSSRPWGQRGLDIYEGVGLVTMLTFLQV